MNRLINKTISILLATAMLNLCWLTSYGWAEMVTTNELLEKEPQLQITREMLIDALNRQDVLEQLEHYGITKEEAVGRINSLTDEEVVALVKDIDSVPVGEGGGGNIGGAIAAAVYLAIIAVILSAYLLGVFFKGIECIFSECEDKGGASYIFRPWWKDSGSSSIETEEECDPGMESCI